MLKTLQNYLIIHDIDVCIVPSSDPHASEYIMDAYKLRHAISGFSGSAGTLVITQQRAFLCTDGRYFIQAKTELAHGIDLYQSPDYVDLLRSLDIRRVAVDFAVFMLDEIESLCELWDVVDVDLARVAGFSVPLSASPVYVAKYATAPKIPQIIQAMRAKSAKHHIISSLDDIAYITGLRASDIAYTPVFVAYMIISDMADDTGAADADIVADTAVDSASAAKVADTAADAKIITRLFIDHSRISAAAKDYLSAHNIVLCGYDEIFDYARGLDGSVLLDSAHTSAKLARQISAPLIRDKNPAVFLKSIKSPQEINLIKRAHIADGVAILRAFMEIERRLFDGLCEYDLGEIFARYRMMDDEYVSDSFGIIAAADSSSAMAHYSAPSHGSRRLLAGSVLLVDSGAQYECGTSDITRVVLLGGVDAYGAGASADRYDAGTSAGADTSAHNDSAHDGGANADTSANTADKREYATSERGYVNSARRLKELVDDYTLVLRAHIRMAKLVHKQGTPMPLLDVMARSVMWEKGVDYLHGTGHGVGWFLGVHEGPQSLSYRAKPTPQSAVQAGMLTSIEPGIYHEGRYGIRLENLYFSVPYCSSVYGEFLRFECVSMYPFERDLIDVSALDADEIAWIDAYHQRVYDALAPHLQQSEREYLRTKTTPLER